MSNQDDLNTSTGDQGNTGHASDRGADDPSMGAGAESNDQSTDESTDTGVEHPERGPEQSMESMTQADPQGIEDPEGIEAIMGDGIGG